MGTCRLGVQSENIFGRFQLNDHAGKPLSQGVMKLARHPVALFRQGLLSDMFRQMYPRLSLLQ